MRGKRGKISHSLPAKEKEKIYTVLSHSISGKKETQSKNKKRGRKGSF